MREDWTIRPVDVGSSVQVEAEERQKIKDNPRPVGEQQVESFRAAEQRCELYDGMTVEYAQRVLTRKDKEEMSEAARVLRDKLKEWCGVLDPQQQQLGLRKLIKLSSDIKASSARRFGYLLQVPELFRRDPQMQEIIYSKLGNGNNLVKLTDETVIDLFEDHCSSFQKESAVFTEQAAEIKNNFINAVHKAITDGVLPLTREEADARLQGVDILFFDVFDLNKSNTGGSFGDKTVQIVSDISRREWADTIYHELVHALAGKKFVLVNCKDGEELITVKEGLQFSAPRKKGEDDMFDRYGIKLKVFLIWLNEAVTERIAEKLMNDFSSGQQYKVTFPPHLMAAFKDLVNLGVSEDMFFKAYFEQKNIADRPHGPALAALMKKIHEVKGLDFFSKIGKSV